MLTRSYAGIDIGSHAIKLVKLTVRSGRVSVAACEHVLTPPGSVQEREVCDPPVVRDLLKELVARHRLSRSRLALAIGGKNLVMRCVTMPRMSEDELREVLKWEAHKHLPIAGEDSVVDFTVVSDQESTDMQVLLVGTYRSTVDRHLQAVLGAGICPDAIEPDQVALARVVAGQYARDQAAVVVDIGMCSVRLVLVKDNVPVLARSFQPGLRQLIRQVAAGSDENEQTAAQTWSEHGVMGTEGTASAVSTAVSGMIREVRQSLDFFFNQDRRTDIGLLVLVGGGAAIPGMAGLFDQVLARGSGVQGGRVLPECSPLAVSVMVGREQKRQVLEPQFASALGLALGRRSR